MTQRTIRSEIEGKLTTWANTKQIKIAYENVEFEKPDSNTWLEFQIIPVTTVNKTVSASRKSLYGLLQINIYSKVGKGTKEAENLAQELIDLFPVVPKTGTVSIEQTGNVLPSIYDGGWRVTPVRFKYRQENY